MRSILLYIVVGLLTFLTACETTTDTTVNEISDEKPGLFVAGVATVTATVEAIDYPSRNVTIKGPRGNVIKLHADERVRNFNQIEVGDKVSAEVLESVAVYVQHHDGSAPSISEAAAVAVAPLGDKPGIAAADTIVITARVEDINYDTRMVKLKGPAGNSKTLKVDEQAPNLDKVKVGDDVVVRHTVAVAIKVSNLE